MWKNLITMSCIKEIALQLKKRGYGYSVGSIVKLNKYGMHNLKSAQHLDSRTFTRSGKSERYAPVHLQKLSNKDFSNKATLRYATHIGLAILSIA